MKKKSYYHATSIKNLESIIEHGIKPGYDGIVYLAETKEDALKFTCLRITGDILIFEVKLPEDKVFETFDHSYNFFKCKSFGYAKTIPFKAIINITKYSMNREDN